MIKRSSVELTALLDIILILLFALMLNYNADVQAVHEENAQLTQEVSELQGQIDELQTELDQAEFLHAQEKETLTTLAKGIGRFLADHDKELQTLIAEADINNRQALIEDLSEFLNEKQVVKELWKHATFVKQFYFVEVGLKSEYNQLYLNQTPTNISIAYEEVDTVLKRNQKKEAIKDAIELVIQEREGGIGTLALSLTLLDQEVYQYAYELTWEAIKELQTKYGTDKIFVTEFTLF